MIREVNDLAVRIGLMLEESEGEITPEVVALSAQLEKDEENLCDNIGNTILNIEAENEALKKEIERLTKRKQSNEKKIDFFKRLVLEHMRIAGIDKLKGQFFKTSIRHSQKVDVSDEEAFTMAAQSKLNMIAEQFPYLRFKVEVNKTAIKDAMKDGAEIDGVVISESESIRFI